MSSARQWRSAINAPCATKEHPVPEALALVNGRVRTLDPANSVVDAIALRDGRILGVGASAAMRALAGPDTRVVDLAGRTVLPGLIDAHTHLEGTALHLANFADCHAPPHRDIAGVLGALREHAAQTPAGEWVIGQGSFLLAEKLAERRYPTLAEFDDAVPDHPALIRSGAHVTVLNSAGLRRAGIDERYQPPVGGHVQRDEHGRPTGVLIELYRYLDLPRFTADQTREAVASTTALLSSYGITSLQDQLPSAGGLRAYQELLREGRLPLRLSFTVHCPNLAAVRAFLAYGLQSGFGDERLRFGAVKFFVDGGITGAAGAFYDDYTHQPGNRGQLKLEQDELNQMAREIDAAGCQMSVHVVGDRALDMLLTALEAIPHPRGLRHRLEHAGHLCMTEERIRRMHALGAVPVVTMPFLNAFGDFLEEYLGARANGAFAMRRLLDASLVVPGSSDSLGAQPESLNPFFGIWCAVARETYLGNQLAPEEAVDVLEALHSYTTAAAWVDYQETQRGTLEPDKLADLIVCDRDPLEIPTAELKAFTPSATILGGAVVSGALPE
jgi:predicted amidohydrolase YtcJ